LRTFIIAKTSSIQVFPRVSKEALGCGIYDRQRYQMQASLRAIEAISVDRNDANLCPPAENDVESLRHSGGGPEAGKKDVCSLE
jgi:hypothetical protein